MPDYSQPLLPHYSGQGWLFNSLDYQIITKSKDWNQGQAERLTEFQEGINKHIRYAALAVPYNDPVKFSGYVQDGRTKGLKFYFRSQWNEWEGANGAGNIATPDSLTSSGLTATCVTQEAHGLQTGDTVSVNGMNETEYRGEFEVVVIDSVTFTYQLTSFAATPATGNIGWRYGRATYLRKTKQFIIDHPSFWQAGDIFCTNVESQQADAQSMTFKTPGTTTFSYSLYNQFLKDLVSTANDAFTQIGLGGQIYTSIISHGVSNLNLNGQTLDDGTTGNASGLGDSDMVTYFGGILSIDHYLSSSYRQADSYGAKYSSDLDKIHAAFPSCKIFISEWGYHTTTITTDSEQDAVYSEVVDALLSKNYIIGVNFWNHLGQTQSSLWTDNSGTIVPGGRLATRQMSRAFINYLSFLDNPSPSSSFSASPSSSLSSSFSASNSASPSPSSSPSPSPSPELHIGQARATTVAEGYTGITNIFK